MIEIKVLKDYAEVSYQQTGTSKVIRKIVGISEIPALFETRITYDSGILPLFGQQNAYGIQRIIQRDNSTIVLAQAINPYVNILHTEETCLDDRQRACLGISHITATHSEVTEEKGDFTCYKNIYLPNLLLSLHLQTDNNGRMKVKQSGLLCYEDTFLSDTTQLYDFPFSNIYRGSTHGGICWGDQEVKVDSVAQSINVIHTFLGSVMNDHLFDSYTLRDFEFECSSQVLAYLALRSSELKRFPYEDFNLDQVIKYKGLINYINENWK